MSEVPDHPDFGYPTGQRDAALEAQARRGLSLFRESGLAIYATEFDTEFSYDDWSKGGDGAISLIGAPGIGTIRGKQALKITAGNASTYNAFAYKVLPYGDYGIIGLEATFALGQNLSRNYFQIDVYSGTAWSKFRIELDYLTNKVYLYTRKPDLSEVRASFIDPIPAGYDYRVSNTTSGPMIVANVKMTIDASSLMYDGFYFNDLSYNIETAEPYIEANTTPRCIVVSCGVDDFTGAQGSAVVDSIVVTKQDTPSSNIEAATIVIPSPSDEIVADYIIVGAGGGGGGGGGNRAACGGGGGEVVVRNLQVLSGTNAVVVGNAGLGGAGNNQGNDGGNSSFAGLTAIGGGGGERDNFGAGRNGGSGGGGHTAGGVSTAVNGVGNSGGFHNAAGGGGGGGGGVGVNGSESSPTSNGGAGGAGLLWHDGNRYGAGGGGGSRRGGVFTGGSGGSGGAGGGGAGGTGGANGANATARGSGGGGGGSNVAGQNQNGGDGFNGTVVIRYLGTPVATGGVITQSGGYTYHTFLASGDFVL